MKLCVPTPPALTLRVLGSNSCCGLLTQLATHSGHWSDGRGRGSMKNLEGPHATRRRRLWGVRTIDLMLVRLSRSCLSNRRSVLCSPQRPFVAYPVLLAWRRGALRGNMRSGALSTQQLNRSCFWSRWLVTRRCEVGRLRRLLSLRY